MRRVETNFAASEENHATYSCTNSLEQEINEVSGRCTLYVLPGGIPMGPRFTFRNNRVSAAWASPFPKTPALFVKPTLSLAKLRPSILEYNAMP